MTNADFSSGYLRNAEFILDEAEEAYRKKIWHMAVRRSQECVELCLKALLRQAGFEVPHLHDVGPILLGFRDRFPGLPVEKLASISRTLRFEREMSFYGDDATETPPEKLYFESDAREALDQTKWLFGTVSAVLKGRATE